MIKHGIRLSWGKTIDSSKVEKVFQAAIRTDDDEDLIECCPQKQNIDSSIKKPRSQ